MNESTREKINNIFNLRRALLLVFQSAPGWTLISFFPLVLQGLLPLASLYIMKLIVDSVTFGSSLSNKDTTPIHVIFLILLAAGVAFLTILNRSILNVVRATQSSIVSDHVFDIIHAKSIEADLEYYENPKYFDILYRAQNDAPLRPSHIVNSLFQIVQNSVSLVVVFGLIASFNLIVALSLTISAIPVAFVSLVYSNKSYQLQRACTPKERKAWYFHWLLTSDGNVKEIKLFNLGPLFMRKYHNLRKELRNKRLSIIKKQSIANLVAQSISIIAIFGSYIYIATSAFQGNITIGDLVMYFGALQQGYSFLSNVLDGFAEIYDDNLFMKTLYEFLDLKSVLKEPHDPIQVPKKLKKGILFENVSFIYPGQGNQVLIDINLRISPDQVIALVGENGSGKTTLTKLLCRLYDPTEGKITLDGVDLRDFRTLDVRKEISIVFQDYTHYNLTARENIWFGNIDMPMNEEYIQRASEYSGAKCIIDQLENGYDTILGKWLEDGTELSIGEWQKIALARAFFHDSQIIVLDEPTSSLDPKAEEEVFSKFRQLVKDKTAIIISHRLSTVKMADCIYFMKGGKIIEQGDHEELMYLNGDYAQLFKIQSQHYN